MASGVIPAAKSAKSAKAKAKSNDGNVVALAPAQTTCKEANPVVVVKPVVLKTEALEDANATQYHDGNHSTKETEKKDTSGQKWHDAHCHRPNKVVGDGNSSGHSRSTLSTYCPHQTISMAADSISSIGEIIKENVRQEIAKILSDEEWMMRARIKPYQAEPMPENNITELSEKTENDQQGNINSCPYKRKREPSITIVEVEEKPVEVITMEDEDNVIRNGSKQKLKEVGKKIDRSNSNSTTPAHETDSSSTKSDAQNRGRTNIKSEKPLKLSKAKEAKLYPKFKAYGKCNKLKHKCNICSRQHFYYFGSKFRILNHKNACFSHCLFCKAAFLCT